jgi:hypothetical protein
MTRDAHVKFHAYAEIFPLLEGEEFDQLVAYVRPSAAPKVPR